MTVVVEKAFAKVNLALHVMGRRLDGYHELDSIVAFADVADVLEIAPAPHMSLRVKGPFAADVPSDGSNLILKAHQLLSAHVELPPVAVSLEKNLPVAAGIGGGSADAAAALRAFRLLAQISVPDDVMDEVALRLGADVPVCLRQKACRMQGVGERLAALSTLPSAAIVLVNPGYGCGTAEVFTALGLIPGASHRAALDPAHPATWRNDLTESALRVRPGIADVLAALEGCEELTSVRMSGSGATCFGLAHGVVAAEAAVTRLSKQHPTWWVRAATLF
jgi:4-diphosphocytidyl-2-C-methyl-D-erythritol kinase